MDIDWTKPEMGDPKPGLYSVEVKKAQERTSKKGDPMFEIELIDFATSEPLCRDYLVYSDSGWGMMKGKLKCLGIVGEDPAAKLTTEDLLGRRAIVALGINEYTNDKGKTYRNLQVDITGGGRDSSHCGYWAIDDPEAPGEKELVQLAPF